MIYKDIIAELRWVYAKFRRLMRSQYMMTKIVLTRPEEFSDYQFIKFKNDSAFGKIKFRDSNHWAACVWKINESRNDKYDLFILIPSGLRHITTGIIQEYCLYSDETFVNIGKFYLFDLAQFDGKTKQIIEELITSSHDLLR